MELLKQLFSSQTAYGRVIRTFIQAFIGICIAVLAVVSLPEFTTWFGEQPWLAQIGGVAGVIAFVSAIQNALGKLWDAIEEW